MSEEEEVHPMMAEEAQPSIPKEQSPSNIVTRVLGELKPQEEIAEFKSNDKGESNNVPIIVPEEN